MKQSHILSVALIVTLAIAPFVQAQSTSTASSTERDGIFSTVRENIEDIRENVQDRVENREERRTALEARSQERITNLAANISNRFDGIIARLQNIIDRLERRIDKEASEGKNIDAARESLSAAETALGSAKAQMNDIDETVADALGSTDPRGKWVGVRSKFLIARDHIKTAHAELRNTIINLKAAPQAAEATSSSTEVTN